MTILETIETYFERQISWSKNTFGPALRTKGVIDHIRKELVEIEAKPHDLSEWIDVVILAMDGYWRHGGSAADLLPALLAKQQKNMARIWPDWRGRSEDQAIEHDRSGEAPRLPHITPHGIGVKGLEWLHTGSFLWGANSEFGIYSYWQTGEDFYVLFPGDRDHAGRKVTDPRANAQADYETRLKSALQRNPEEPKDA